MAGFLFEQADAASSADVKKTKQGKLVSETRHKLIKNRRIKPTEFSKPLSPGGGSVFEKSFKEKRAQRSKHFSVSTGAAELHCLVCSWAKYKYQQLSYSLRNQFPQGGRKSIRIFCLKVLTADFLSTTYYFYSFIL